MRTRVKMKFTLEEFQQGKGKYVGKIIFWKNLSTMFNILGFLLDNLKQRISNGIKINK